jgi:hypothetical protein
MVMTMLMMLKIDALASNDPSYGDDGYPSASSPSGVLPKVRFWCFLVAMCPTSQILLHKVNMFDEEVSMRGGTVRWYGWA